MTGVELESCRVKLYAATGAQASAGRRVLVGTGFVAAGADTHKLSVRVVLNRTGKALLRRSPNGLRVAVEITGTPVSGAAIRATGSARLVAKRTTVVIGGYDADEATLTAAARRTLRALAPSLAKGARVRIAGHTDNSARSASYLRQLGLRRAKTVRAFLAARGARAAMHVASYGARDPRATNATAAGRAANRRVVLTIVR
jgi:outer membrane protein OmpA-like peptidoglycan-associated protein